MNSLAKFLIAIIILVTLGLTLIVAERHRLMIALIGEGKPPAMLDKTDEGEAAKWFDDYYTVEEISDRTYAIVEPRYEQQNINYLIVGETRAILFDAGSGFRDIRPVVESLTDLPVTFLPSHFHYDHVGNGVPFATVAVVDLPHLRARAKDNDLQLEWQEHLGAPEGYTAPTFKVAEWVKPGELVDLGNRVLEVYFTPGHTNDSISLFDRQRNILFSGDFLYPGALYAFLPNSNMADYEQGADDLLANLPIDVAIYGAHRVEAPGAPSLTFDDLGDLKMALLKIREVRLQGEDIFPVVYKINSKLSLLAEPPMLQTWQASYPALSVATNN